MYKKLLVIPVCIMLAGCGIIKDKINTPEEEQLVLAETVNVALSAANTYMNFCDKEPSESKCYDAYEDIFIGTIEVNAAYEAVDKAYTTGDNIYLAFAKAELNSVIDKLNANVVKAKLENNYVY